MKNWIFLIQSNRHFKYLLTSTSVDSKSVLALSKCPCSTAPKRAGKKLKLSPRSTKASMKKDIGNGFARHVECGGKFCNCGRAKRREAQIKIRSIPCKWMLREGCAARESMWIDDRPFSWWCGCCFFFPKPSRNSIPCSECSSACKKATEWTFCKARLGLLWKLETNENKNESNEIRASKELWNSEMWEEFTHFLLF